MHCEEVKSLLERGVEGGLNLPEAAALEEHVSRCDACREEHDRMVRFFEVLEGGPDAAPPAGFAARVMVRVRTDGRPGVGFFPSAVQIVFALGVVVMFGTAVLGLGTDRMTDLFTRLVLLPAGQMKELLAAGSDLTARIPGGPGVLIAPFAVLVLAGLAILAFRDLGSGPDRRGSHGR